MYFAANPSELISLLNTPSMADKGSMLRLVGSNPATWNVDARHPAVAWQPSHATKPSATVINPSHVGIVPSCNTTDPPNPNVVPQNIRVAASDSLAVNHPHTDTQWGLIHNAADSSPLDLRSAGTSYNLDSGHMGIAQNPYSNFNYSCT